jgi:hypothetical protein
MILDETKFPFKWMPRIIQVFNSYKKPLPAYKIASMIGSCSSDAKETLQMMQYIASHGRILEISGKWRREVFEDIASLEKPKFRYRYIKEVIDLLDHVPSDSITSEELSSLNGKERSEIERSLNFIAKITQNGKIRAEGKLVSQKWSLISWTNSKEVK